jgi:hypothetical protein
MLKEGLGNGCRSVPQIVTSGVPKRESELRIHPGALLEDLQMAVKKKAPAQDRGFLSPLSEHCVHRSGGVSHVVEYTWRLR